MAYFSDFLYKKINIFKKISVGMAVWLQYVRESQNKVRTTISYDIVTLYHV